MDNNSESIKADDKEKKTYNKREKKVANNKDVSNQADKQHESDEKTTSVDKELEETKEKYVRLFAEFENFKKRSLKERLELMGTANKDMMLSMLPILDDILRAEQQLEEKKLDIDAFTEGIKIIFQKIKTTLESKGLKHIECLGEEFDTGLHEAITEIPANNEYDKGKIIDEVQKGYKLNDKIIRFAKVVVGK